MRVDYHIGSRRYVTIQCYPSVLGTAFGDFEDTPCTVLEVCVRHRERHELCSDMFTTWPSPFFDLNEAALNDTFHLIYSMIGAVRVARIEHPELDEDLAVWERELETALHHRAANRRRTTNQGETS